MKARKLEVFVLLCTTINLINFSGVCSKSLPNGDSQQLPQPPKPPPPHVHAKPVETVSLSPLQTSPDYQQHQPQSQHNGEMNYPQYDDESVGSYDYRSVSDEVMPVKNSEFVPVESSEDYNSTNGFPPQRQQSMQEIWQQYHNSMTQQQQQHNGNPNKDVQDEGALEVIGGIPNNYGNNADIAHQHQSMQMQPVPPPAPPPAEQQYQQQQHHQHQNHPYYQIPSDQYQYYEEVLPIAAPAPTPSALPPTKISKVAKLTVIARKNEEGKKIAVVKDKFRVNRQRRSMMTLSREDENDSEYDDLNSSENFKTNSTTTTTTKTPTMTTMSNAKTQ